MTTPDLFSYYLTGEANNEYTIASTSELLNASTKDWDWETIDQLGLPRHIFGKIVMPGTVRSPAPRNDGNAWNSGNCTYRTRQY